MKIAFAGSHGVGKTTMARWLAKKLGYTLIPDISRELRILGLYPDRGQKKVEHYAYTLWKQQRLEKANESFIADSSQYTNLVYATYDGIVEEHLEWMVAKYTKYDKVFYLSPDIELQSDAIRGDDNGYREEIDKMHRHLLDDFGIKYIEVGGDIKSRERKILNYIPKE